MGHEPFNVGDGGFIAYFSNGNGTHADWAPRRLAADRSEQLPWLHELREAFRGFRVHLDAKQPSRQFGWYASWTAPKLIESVARVASALLLPSAHTLSDTGTMPGCLVRLATQLIRLRLGCIDLPRGASLCTVNHPESVDFFDDLAGLARLLICGLKVRFLRGSPLFLQNLAIPETLSGCLDHLDSHFDSHSLQEPLASGSRPRPVSPGNTCD